MEGCYEWGLTRLVISEIKKKFYAPILSTTSLIVLLYKFGIQYIKPIRFINCNDEQICYISLKFCVGELGVWPGI